MKKVIVIGGGAAGMMAAITAAKNGCQVDLFEQNEKLGKKIFITGKGRCNLTNACDIENLFRAVLRNPKFLYSSFYGFTNEQTMEFFEEAGLELKTERGERVFPNSDHSSDVIRVLKQELQKNNADVYLYTKADSMVIADGKFCGVKKADGEIVRADACIVATGGYSYQSTGSTGDGYRFAKEAGHKVQELVPALVPMTAKEEWVKELQGLSLRNVEVRIFQKKKKLYEGFGEMLFTHYGVSGPLVLTASSLVGRKLKQEELRFVIDLKPALSKEQLDQRVLREFEENHNKQFGNAVEKLFPAKLRPVMLELCGIDPRKRVHEITREERQHFVELIKNLELTLTGLRGFSEAIITSGGVNVKEIDPGTMESKLVKGLYFAGEVLDLDAQTGGFNLQIAWSTGYTAGLAAAYGE